ncbi:hypothetical protein CW706_00450 [Candidatus Bathyarchaeota archaeon]|nr:MAG: hypothetical protein CW706_00450 [Candidatus Bathyarchaeota archaeon]
MGASEKTSKETLKRHRLFLFTKEVDDVPKKVLHRLDEEHHGEKLIFEVKSQKLRWELSFICFVLR